MSGDKNSFSHTTIANLDPESPLLWVHTIFAILFVPLVVLVMLISLSTGSKFDLIFLPGNATIDGKKCIQNCTHENDNGDWGE